MQGELSHTTDAVMPIRLQLQLPNVPKDESNGISIRHDNIFRAQLSRRLQ